MTPINAVIHEDINHIISSELPWSRFADSRVLVTGANGMLPSYVIYTLLGLNDKYHLNIQVIGLARNEEKAKRILAPILDRRDFQLTIQDLSKPISIDGDISHIFHGGSPARPKEHGSSPTTTLKANLLGTINLLDMAVEKKCRGFIFFSSSEVYGSLPGQTTPILENQYGSIDILNPRSCYSEGKRAAETICASYRAEFGIRCVMPRFAHIYGPGLELDDGRVQADFASNIISGRNISMNSDGSAVRAYTYVSDAVCGLFYALLKGDEMAYNIADGDGIVSIRKLAESFVAARPDKNLTIDFHIPKGAPAIYNPAKFIGLDVAKITALGWKPTVHLEEGIDRMLSFYETVRG